MRCDSASTRGTASIRSQAVRRIRFSGMSVVNSSCRISSGSGSPWWRCKLLAFAQPAAQHLGAFLNDDVAGEQALVDGAFGLPPQRLGDDGHQVRGLRHGYRVRLPRGAVLGVAEEEKQPGDLDLRLDADLDIADPGRADLPGRADQPDSRAVGGRHGGDDA